MSVLFEVEVLLATYNGERFLREQIDSILAQDCENVRVLARDDGSDDRTWEILRGYAERYPRRFRVMPPDTATGSPKGNFLRLMKESTADYICFADQDDVWLPDKVSRTAEVMKHLEACWGTDVPLLVFTDLQVVDAKLKVVYASFWAHMGIDPNRIGRLGELLGKSTVTGCTAMLNRRLLDLSTRMPEEASMHDRWIAYLASSLGKSGIVRQQTVLYRQHDRNVVGTGGREPEEGTARDRLAPLNMVQRYRRLASEHLIEWQANQRQIRAFLKVHGAELPADKHDLLVAYLTCETSKSRFIRVSIFIRYGFYYVGLRRNVITILHLWRLKNERSRPTLDIRHSPDL